MTTHPSQEGESKDFKKFYSNLAEALPNYREDIMTLAHQLKQEGLQQGLQRGLQRGLQQGLQQGRQEVLTLVRNLLKQNVPLATIKLASGLSEQELLELEES